MLSGRAYGRRPATATARALLPAHEPVSAGAALPARALPGARERATTRALLAAVLLLVAFAPAARVAAQDIGGRRLGPLTLSGEASGSFAPEDTAFFNDTGYDVYPLRLLWLSASAELRLGARAAVLAEVVSENVDAPRLRGAYLRLRPFRERSFDVQAGRVPPVFGSFARNSYGSSNPLIGLPLGYQYLTTLRADAAPESADNLLRMRGRGWLVRYPVGNPLFAPGLPLASSRFWDVGVQARIGVEPVTFAVALTQGTLAAPRFHDDNGGKQLSARLGFSPRTGLLFGASFAGGEYADRDLTADLPPAQASRTLRQLALGGDAEYSWGHWLLRAEAVYSRSDLPELQAPPIDAPVEALALSVEGVRRLVPGLYAAARFDHLGFSRISGTSGSAGWDAPVTRIEAGMGFQPWRPLTLKAVYQQNWREEGFPGRHVFVAVQALVRF